ncbi:MAG: biotin--[acetyl-CoA-carboxylase] ligase [Prevotella sp.]|nr:biotin--[acetyl-CoA-carboxylase] ligase [Prevotella sp.]
MVKTLYLEETDSTNDFLRQYTPGEDENMTVVWTDFQRKGRGQGTNHWESEAGKNLTFSVLIHPHEVLAKDQYIISMAVAETIHRYLSGLTNSAVSIKWPNDIYVGDFKIAGILIENSLSGEHIRDCIIGIGLNVNQTVFESDAPNPISLRMIENKEWNREEVLQGLTEELVWQFRHFHIDVIREKYRRHLYRREGIYPYRDAEGEFEAELIDVENDGHLVLLDAHGQCRRYAFKEVAFVI